MDIWHDPLFLAALKKGGAGGTASGDIVTFTAPKASPLKALTLSIDPVQAGTGDPSPDNVRPISGWDAANVWRTGKNLFDETDLRQGGGYWTSYGPFAQRVSLVHLISCKPNTTYTVSRVAGELRFAVQQYENTSTVNDDNPCLKDSGWKTDVYSFTTNQNSHYLFLTFSSPNYSYDISPSDVQNGNFQLELGSTPTPYTPYTGTTIPITFTEAGTVYGGVWDVIGGVLRVTHAEVDLGTLTWTKIKTSGDHWRFWAMLNTMRLGGQMISSQYRQISATEQYIGTQGIANQASGSNMLAMVSDERYADAVAFKAAMSGVQLVYELATPVTYTLTPQQLDTLAGQNVVWGDSGAVSLEYAGGGVSKDMMLAAILHEARQ